MKAKRPNKTFKAPLQEITSLSRIELVLIDFVHLEKSKGGYEYLSSLLQSKYSMISYYDLDHQAEFHHDQGHEFENELFHGLQKLCGIRRLRTTSYHPEGNGQIERLNRTLLQMLRTLPESLNHIINACNCTRQDSTGYSPHFLLFGRNA